MNIKNLSEKIFKQVFGISHIRFYHMLKQLEKGTTTLPQQIIDGIGGSFIVQYPLCDGRWSCFFTAAKPQK